MTIDEVRRVMGDEEFEEAMVAFATTASSKVIRLSAELTLRKMYPSKTAKKLLSPDALTERSKP